MELMIHITGIFDKDPHRKKNFIHLIKKMLPGDVSRSFKQYDIGDMTLFWSTVSDTPIDMYLTRNNNASYFYIGNQKGNIESANSAKKFASDLDSNNIKGNSFKSEYFLGIKISNSGEIDIVADTLGYFPLYYWSSPSNNVFIFSTLPGIPLFHQLCKRDINFRGLVGILLFSHIIEREIIWKGIFRLSAGNRLKWSPGSRIIEKRFNFLYFSDNYFGKSIEYCTDLLHQVLDSVVKDIAEISPVSIMLSGGLDSRIISGYLNKNNAEICSVLIFGNRRDYDCIYATNVAKILGWEPVLITDRPIDVLDHFFSLIELEQATVSISSFDWLRGIPYFKSNNGVLTGGFFGDVIIGGYQISTGYDEATDSYRFINLFNNINKWGLPPEIIKSLLKVDKVEKYINESFEILKESYDSYRGRDFQKTLLFSLLHQERFRVAPEIARLSSGKWPRIPFLHPDILSICSGLPNKGMLKRRLLEINLLKTKHPDLATVSLTGKPEKVLHPHRFRMRRYLSRLISNGSDYHRRNFEINNKDWTRVRKVFEEYRYGMSEIFNMDEINKIIPPPSEKIKTGFISETGKIKTLMMLIILLTKMLKEK